MKFTFKRRKKYPRVQEGVRKIAESSVYRKLLHIRIETKLRAYEVPTPLITESKERETVI